MKQTQINLKKISNGNFLFLCIWVHNYITVVCVLFYSTFFFFSFLNFHTFDTDLKQRDPILHEHCVDFIEILKLQQSKCSKQVSKEITRKR